MVRLVYSTMIFVLTPILCRVVITIFIIFPIAWADDVLPQLEKNIIATFNVQAELLVTNIFGLSSIRQVSPFHVGGAIPSNPEFLIETLSDHVLDPERLLVGSASNYGLTLYNNQMLPGTILSLDVSQGPYAIPHNLATKNGNTSGRNIMIYSAQNKKYINAYYNDNAVTRYYPNISNPKYISINNAFGRPWQANAPFGVKGSGFISVSDPDGRPLANPPSIDNGGVFFGEVSNRVYGEYKTVTYIRRLLPGNFARETSHQYILGNLNAASISTTFMGTSPDSSNFAVFASVGVDGSVSQIHVQDGVDGLAKAVIKPHRDDTTSAGTVFRWVPSFALYITDFYGDRIAELSLMTDKNSYYAKKVSYITSPDIKKPVDIAAVIPEIANPRFSSNTTMAGTSDLYIANKQGTIVRMDIQGKIIAKVNVTTKFRNSLHGEIKSISTSYDAQTIFIGMEGKDNKDFIVKIPAFNADGFYPDIKKESKKMIAFERMKKKVDIKVTAVLGRKLFTKKFGIKDGIHQVFNANSCITCHDNPVVGGFSEDENNFVRRVSKFNIYSGQFDSVLSHNFPVAKRKDARSLGMVVQQKAGIPTDANIVSMRMPPSLLHIGQLDEVLESALMMHARSKGDGVQGRINYIETANGKKIGRYGWKANQTNLINMVADALATEIGLDNSYTNENRNVDLGNDYIVESIAKFLQQIDLYKK